MLQPLVQHVCPVVHTGPPLHPVGVQLLATHVSPGGHALPHAPQFRLSEVVSLHPDVQHISLTGHATPPLHDVAGWHWLATHALPDGHALPQNPQFAASLVVSMQTAPQHVSFAGHPLVAQVSDVHSPLTHDSPSAHALPHVPQSLASVPRFASQPSASTWSQSANPAEHALIAHWLAAQVTLAFSTGVQTVPHAPQ